MQFRVLGPLEVLGPEGNRIRLASDAQRRLVSLFVIHANTIVRAEELEDHLGLTAGALRTSVSRLRRVVGFDILATAPPGYELRTDRIDLIEFERSLADARSSEVAIRRAALEAAVQRWRGEAFAEFSHEPWAAAEAQRLEELRSGATEALAACCIEMGDECEAIAMLERLIASHPYRDRPRGLPCTLR